MKVLVLYDCPPSPGGRATPGDLLSGGLLEVSVDAQAVHFESAQEKEWYYRCLEPDAVVENFDYRMVAKGCISFCRRAALGSNYFSSPELVLPLAHRASKGSQRGTEGRKNN